MYYGQYRQDEFLDTHIFKGMRNGVFFEMGADDGVSGSNTVFFERECGWTGICVEPRKAAFDKLVKNRTCICEDICVSNESGKKEFLEIHDSGDQLSGLVENYDKQHIERIKKESTQAETIQIECLTMNDLLKKHGISKLDYFSLDIEGGELGILESIDFNSITINCLSVENNYSDPAIKRFLKKKGYRRVTKIKIDEIYVLKKGPFNEYHDPLKKQLTFHWREYKKKLKKLLHAER